MDVDDWQKVVQTRDKVFFKNTYLYDTMKFLKKDKTKEMAYLRGIFYGLVNNMNNLEYEKSFLQNILEVTILLRLRMKDYDLEKRNAFYSDIYCTYIKTMYEYLINGDYDSVKALFQVMNEKMKMMSGYYGNDGLQEESFTEICKKYLLA